VAQVQSRTAEISGAYSGTENKASARYV